MINSVDRPPGAGSRRRRARSPGKSCGAQARDERHPNAPAPTPVADRGAIVVVVAAAVVVALIVGQGDEAPRRVSSGSSSTTSSTTPSSSASSTPTTSGAASTTAVPRSEDPLVTAVQQYDGRYTGTWETAKNGATGTVSLELRVDPATGTMHVDADFDGDLFGNQTARARHLSGVVPLTSATAPVPVSTDAFGDVSGHVDPPSGSCWRRARSRIRTSTPSRSSDASVPTAADST